MVLDDKLAKVPQEQRRTRNIRLDEEEENEEWLMYADREKQPWLNKDQGVFTHTDEKSLNRAPDVFDATAVFKTARKEGNNDEV